MERANEAREELGDTIKESEVAAPSVGEAGGPSHQSISAACNRSTSGRRARVLRRGAGADQTSAARTAIKVAVGDGTARRLRDLGPRSHGARIRNARAERSRGRKRSVDAKRRRDAERGTELGLEAALTGRENEHQQSDLGETRAAGGYTDSADDEDWYSWAAATKNHDKAGAMTTEAHWNCGGRAVRRNRNERSGHEWTDKISGADSKEDNNSGVAEAFLSPREDAWHRQGHELAAWRADNRHGRSVAWEDTRSRCDYTRRSAQRGGTDVRRGGGRGPPRLESDKDEASAGH